MVQNYQMEICGAKVDDEGTKFCPQSADKCNDHPKSRGSCFSGEYPRPFLAIYCDQSKASAWMSPKLFKSSIPDLCLKEFFLQLKETKCPTHSVHEEHYF